MANLETKANFYTDCFKMQKNFANSLCGDLLLILWSFLEAIFWFILPDFLIFPLTILAPHKTKRWITLSVCSSFAGTIVFIFLFHIIKIDTASKIFQLPFTSVEMLFKIANWAHLHGYNSILFQSFSGIPVKVWTYSAYYILHWNLLIFLVFLTISRAIRMILIGYLGKILIKKVPGIISKYWLPLGLIYTALSFIVLNRIS